MEGEGREGARRGEGVGERMGEGKRGEGENEVRRSKRRG